MHSGQNPSPPQRIELGVNAAVDVGFQNVGEEERVACFLVLARFEQPMEKHRRHAGAVLGMCLSGSQSPSTLGLALSV